jgi:hypothetical protein
MWTYPYAYLWMIPLAIAGLAVIPYEWSVPYLRDEVSARGFLEVLWQVDAAALALSVAVVVVALEVFSSGRSGSLQENIRQTALLPITFIGATALLVNGLVLIELPRPPRGGPATWVAVLSGLSLVLLPVLFGRASRAIDRAEILKTRAARAAEEARRAVEQSLFDRVAYALLIPLCNDASVQLQPFLPPPMKAGAVAILAKRQSVVNDINVYWLARLARLAIEVRDAGGNGDITLGIRVGSRIGVGDTLLTLSSDMPRKATRMGRRVVKT